MGFVGFLVNFCPPSQEKEMLLEKTNVVILALMQVPVDGATDSVISPLTNMNFYLPCERGNEFNL